MAGPRPTPDSSQANEPVPWDFGLGAESESGDSLAATGEAAPDKAAALSDPLFPISPPRET